ncbi:unnamed protein product [Gadus morhua 'NCC']
MLTLHWTQLTLHWTQLTLHWTQLTLHWTQLTLTWTQLTHHWTQLTLHWTQLALRCMDSFSGLGCRKGIPKKLAAMAKHKYTVSQKDELTFCAWQDTKTVLVLSNFHAPTATGTVKRRHGGTIQTEVTVPACLADYQRHMKGIDLLDQMCATAPVAASAQHDCEKIYEKRKICRECSQLKNGTEARPGATVYGCRQCNVPLHIECFGKHVRRT